MKKSNVILVMLSVMAIITTNCVKENESENKVQKQVFSSTAVKLSAPSPKATPGFSGNYVLNSRAGHSSSECGGSCIVFGGVKKHINCQGFGSSCGLKASVRIRNAEADSSNNYVAVGLNDYEPTDEDVYLMPARSFYVEDKNTVNGYIWLNIPEQLLERDTLSKQFIYYKISFTQEALFENF
ncbi:MAG: hypothetical protein HXX18_03130 [Bacteroidetes bacterium]|nr:hypothetical protein [Bacteroidota bacterium]